MFAITVAAQFFLVGTWISAVQNANDGWARMSKSLPKMKTNSTSNLLSIRVFVCAFVFCLSFLFCGCDTPEQNNAASALYNANAALATDPRQAVLYGVVGAAFANEAQMQNQREVAEAGRTQITVNNSANVSPQPGENGLNPDLRKVVESGVIRSSITADNTGKRQVETPTVVKSAPDKIGLLMVTAADDLFNVYVDGQFVGNTPAKLRLIEGKYAIDVKKLGYRDCSRVIYINAGDELNLKANLDKLQ